MATQIKDYNINNTFGLSKLTVKYKTTEGNKYVITLSGELTDIRYRHFVENEACKELIFDKYVTALSERCFRYCINLEKITLQNSVNDISTSAFNDCPSLREIHYNGTKSEWESIPNINTVTIPENVIVYDKNNDVLNTTDIDVGYDDTTTPQSDTTTPQSDTTTSNPNGENNTTDSSDNNVDSSDTPEDEDNNNTGVDIDDNTTTSTTTTTTITPNPADTTTTQTPSQSMNIYGECTSTSIAENNGQQSTVYIGVKITNNSNTNVVLYKINYFDLSSSSSDKNYTEVATLNSNTVYNGTSDDNGPYKWVWVRSDKANSLPSSGGTVSFNSINNLQRGTEYAEITILPVGNNETTTPTPGDNNTTTPAAENNIVYGNYTSTSTTIINGQSIPVYAGISITNNTSDNVVIYKINKGDLLNSPDKNYTEVAALNSKNTYTGTSDDDGPNKWIWVKQTSTSKLNVSAGKVNVSDINSLSADEYGEITFSNN